MKYIQTIFLIVILCFASCLQKASSAFDPRESLDFNYSSILIEETTTIRDVAKKITGTWVGNYDLLNASTKKGKYILTVEYKKEEFFIITETLISKKREIHIQMHEVILSDMDDYYVFDTGEKLIQINYLSDKQLKLDEHIFVRKNAK